MLKIGGWWLKGGTLHRVVLFPRHLTPHCLSPGGGQGAGDREKRGRDVYGRREKRGSKAGETGEKYAPLRNISQSKKRKEVGANRYSAGTGIKGYGKREV